MNSQDTFELIRNNTLFNIIVEAFKTAARLGYSEGELRFDDDTLNAIFRVMFPEDYKETYERLIKEKEEKDKDF